MSKTRRRLSHNGGFLGAPLSEDEDDDQLDPMMMSPEKSKGLKRMSFGGRRQSTLGLVSSSPQMSMVEQSRIADMYKLVIKMSSENVRLNSFLSLLPK